MKLSAKNLTLTCSAGRCGTCALVTKRRNLIVAILTSPGRRLNMIKAEAQRPIFGCRIREAFQIVREALHVRKCREADCPRCDELGVNGRWPVYPDRQPS